MTRKGMYFMCVLVFVLGIGVFAYGGEARFYWDSGCSGKVLHVAPGTQYENLSYIGWNDRISSYELDGDVECVVTKDSKFGGEYMYLEPGTQKSSLPKGWNDKISSIMCAEKGYFDKTEDGYDTESAAYEHNHFAGVKLMLSGNTRIKNLKDLSFNDFISSVRISHNDNFSCTFYKDSDYKVELFTRDLGKRQQIRKSPKEKTN